MEGRIRHLEHLLDVAEILEPGQAGYVAPGSIVTFVYEGDDEEDMAERYLIGHMEEKTDGLEVMSPQSPLGSALLGKGVGEWVEYQAPNGVLRVKVLEVENA
jgi:transcription elongation factor GreA